MFFGKVQDDGNGDDGDAEVLVCLQCTLVKQRSPTWCEMDSKSVRKSDNSFLLPNIYNQHTISIPTYTLYIFIYDIMTYMICNSRCSIVPGQAHLHQVGPCARKRLSEVKAIEAELPDETNAMNLHECLL